MTLETAPVRPLLQKIEPKSATDQTSLVEALKRLALVDSAFTFHIDAESGETILSGTSEPQLEAKVQRLSDEYGIAVLVGAPKVAYRETLARAAEIDYTHKKLTGGTRQFARVILDLEPNGKDQGNVFENTIAEGAVPNEIIQAVEKGVRSVWDNGVLFGFPIVDMKVSLYDAAYHEADSSAVAFEIAARAAMKEGCEKGGMHILEPIMKVEIETSAECVGRVISNVRERRGQISSQEMRGEAALLQAHIPLANMFGYISDLRQLTSGRGTYEMRYDHYPLLPRNISGGPNDFPPAVGMRA